MSVQRSNFERVSDAAGLPKNPRPALLYDGECGLCNAIVRWLLRTDKQGRLSYAPLQSEPAQAYLRTQGLPTADFDSLVFVPDWNRPTPGSYRLRTDGALAAWAAAGGGGVIGSIKFLPAAVRDLGYKLVARTRYLIFGKYRPRPLANPDWERRFL